MKTRRFSCCSLVYYTCERLARILANLPAGLKDLISFRTDRNTCNPITKKAFLIIHPTQLFLVIQKGRQREREKELSRLYVVTNLSWLCKKPALITRRNQETSSDCASERVCVLLPCFSRRGIPPNEANVISQIFSESENIITSSGNSCCDNNLLESIC